MLRWVRPFPQDDGKYRYKSFAGISKSSHRRQDARKDTVGNTRGNFAAGSDSESEHVPEEPPQGALHEAVCSAC